MTRRAATAVLAALLVAVPAVARADRAPSHAERAGVARAVGVPARCLQVRVSMVEGRYRYASASLRNTRSDCQRYAADGVAVFKRRVTKGARWRFVTAGSSFECPVPRVPARVVADLGIRCDEPEARRVAHRPRGRYPSAVGQ